MNLKWVVGKSPKQLDENSIKEIKQLFYRETGEEYFEGSIRALPIQEWDGNLILIDCENPSKIHGLLWATKFSDERARIVAFAIDRDLQGMGLGSKGWNLLIDACLKDGHSELQLEVRASNSRAIDFYRKRGLEVIGELKGYYKEGLGLVMRGNIQSQ